MKIASSFKLHLRLHLKFEQPVKHATTIKIIPKHMGRINSRTVIELLIPLWQEDGRKVVVVNNGVSQ